MATQADIKAGSAWISLGLLDEDFDKKIALQARKFERLARQMQSIGRQMAVAGLVFTAPFLAATRAYAAYSKQLAFVATMLDRPAEHMTRYSKALRAMSVEFGQSTEALAGGLYDILSAGFAADKALSMLAVTSKAALGGMTDVKTATKAVVSMMLGYSLSAEHAQEVSDSLFMTVKRGRLTFQELAQDIGKIASTAAGAGVTMDELGASIAIITKGLTSTEATVAMSNILQAFYKPSVETQEMAAIIEKATGIKVSRKGIQETPGGFRTILKRLLKLGEGEGGTEILAQLFPSKRGMRGIMPMVAALKDFDMIFDSWANKLGEADNAAEKVRKSFGFFIDQLKQAGVLALSYMGEALADSIKGSKASILDMVVGMGKWIKQNKQLIADFAKIFVSLLIVGAALFAFGKILGAVALVMQVWSSSLWGPYGVIIGLVTVAATVEYLNSKLVGANNALRDMAQLGKLVRESVGEETLLGGGTATFHKVKEYEGIVTSIAKKITNIRRWKENVMGNQSAFGIWGEFSGTPFGYHTWNKKEAETAGLPGAGVYLPSSPAMQEWLSKTAPNKLAQLTQIMGKYTKLLKEARKEHEKTTAPIEKQIALEKERAAILATTGTMRRGQYLGYWNTPQTLWNTSVSKEDQGNDFLSDIKDNTKELTESGTLAKRIAEAVDKVGD